ncbi:2-phospho-L-lactate guanylyltransferase [Microbacterium lacticum]|uniref:2-phospho-L-lactate guanylyltransferase n=1 Tax=Microbacterium lacticum TaxID=33885 RepID=UPI0028D5750A|nr:2-phospho-L-lactate guanylyltransferase [Microbacterium lacticum]
MIPVSWTVMIPVKPPLVGKSRLGPATPERAALAAALALDTIGAVARARGVGRVMVVTADASFAQRLPRDVEVVAEPRPAGIDAALGRAAARAGDATPRAALPADLAALQPEELATALEDAAAWPRAVVPDAEGCGTTLLTAAAGVPWRSAYGPESFSRHVTLGCHALTIAEGSGLRCDLDTPAQLAAARGVLGARTLLAS